MAQPFNLVIGPVCRFQMLKLAPDRYHLIFTTHHAVCDGWSFGVLFQELADLYTALVVGKPKAIKPAMQFREYAEWCAAQLQTVDSREAEAFWMEKFADTDTPILDLPYDRPRPALKSYNGSLAVHRCDPETFRQLKHTSGQMGQTVCPSPVLGATFARQERRGSPAAAKVGSCRAVSGRCATRAGAAGRRSPGLGPA